MKQERVRRIVVLGGGSAGWMTAAALARSVGDRVSLTLVESDEIGTVGVGEATIPLIHRFNQHLGLDEREFMRATQATFKLGIEFVDWTRPGDRYFHGFGRFRPDAPVAGLEHVWRKLHARGQALPLGAYGITTQAALAGRFAPPAPDRPDSPLSDLAYAYHFDASLYAAHLRRFAEQLGVLRVEGRVEHVAHDGTGTDRAVRALVLQDGRRIDGDFFVDCSGFRARLIGQALGSAYDDWSDWLPCDRAVAVPSAATQPLLPFTRSTAREAGWQWRIPLRHRTGNGHVYSSRHTSDDEATATLMANLDAEPLAEPRSLRFVPGVRRRSWQGNCVAIGLAAGFIEPLESTSLHLIQTAIARLLAFFPSREGSPADIDEYNRQTQAEFEHVRDFVVLHYHANARTGALWAHTRDMPLPASLVERLALYRGHGRLFQATHELFGEVNWVQVLEGQGVRPRGHHPLVDLLNVEPLAQYLEGVRRGIQRCVEAMPTHDEVLQGYCT